MKFYVPGVKINIQLFTNPQERKPSNFTKIPA